MIECQAKLRRLEETAEKRNMTPRSEHFWFGKSISEEIALWRWRIDSLENAAKRLASAI